MDSDVKSMFDREVEELLNSEDNKPIEERVEKIILKYKPLMEEKGIDIYDALNEFIQKYTQEYSSNYFYNEGE